MMDGDQTMKLTQKRLKQIIQEELDYMYAEEMVAEGELDLGSVQKSAMKVAAELMKDGGAIDGVIEKAAAALAKDAPDQIPLIIQVIKQEMAKAQG